MASGTVLLLLQSGGTKFILLLGQIVLAWLLSPEDFGQIAMAYTVTTFVALLVNPGIDVILVRRGRRFHLWSTPAFFFSLSTGLLGSVVILAVAPSIAEAYDTPQLIGLLAVLAFATPFGSLSLVPRAKLRAQMRFKALAAVNLFQSVVQTVLTLAFAAAGFGVFSFVLPVPLVYMAVAAVSWAAARPVVRFRSPFRHWKYLIGDSAYIFGQYFLQTIVSQGDYIILGTLFGDTVLGPYFFAYGIAKQAIQLTAGSIQTALMAGLARMPTFSDQQTRAALRATNGLALIGIPLCLIQAAVARPFLVGLYGDKWVEAIPLVQLISVGMAFDVAAWAACSLLQSRGEFRFLFVWSVVCVPFFIAFIFVGAVYGQSQGVATALCMFNTIFPPMLVCWIFHTSHIPWGEILRIYTRPFLTGLLSAGASAVAIRLSAVIGFPPLLQCGLAIGTGLTIMGITASFIAPATWIEIVTKLQGLIPPLLLARRRSED